MITIKKIRNSLLLILLLLVGFTIQVEAVGVDPSQNGSIELNYQYENQALSNVKVTFYKVADVDALGIYHYTGSFVTQTDELNGLTSSESRELAKKLVDVINVNQIPFLQEGITDFTGKVNLETLSPGIYLVKSDKLKFDSKEYLFSPLLVAIPSLIEEEYVYDLKIDAKVESVDLDPDAGDNGTVNPPSTYDSIIFDICLFIICAIGLIVLFVLWYRKKKKEE